jgi:hypothetical protein
VPSAQRGSSPVARYFASGRGCGAGLPRALSLAGAAHGYFVQTHNAKRSPGGGAGPCVDIANTSEGCHLWGEGVVERLQGMFAFALHERGTGRLALARDRLGIKPLYLSEQPGRRLRFVSSLPALLAAGDVDPSSTPRLCTTT